MTVLEIEQVYKYTSLHFLDVLENKATRVLGENVIKSAAVVKFLKFLSSSKKENLLLMLSK